MGALRVLLLLVAATASIEAGSYDVAEPKEWYEHTILYEIWPASFKDSDGDGVGDLNGITSKLEYVAELGAEMIWIAPFYASPLIDSGYDISDYKDVNPIYGTLEDFDALVARAHELGLKVAVDFVPNHVSDQHPWYLQALEGIEPYVDYFVWNEGIVVNGTRQPPNNWLNMFNSGSTWLWIEQRQAYVYHQFTPNQIDLNYNNPLIIQESKDVLTFWLDRGVDGFRIDAAPFMIEDPQLRDEPLSGMDVPETNYFYHKHVYTKDLQESYEIVKQWKEHINAYTAEKNDGVTRATFTEAYSEIDYIMKYYEYGSDNPFNFFIINDGEIAYPAVTETATNMVDIIDNWMSNMPTDRSANWVLGNHDFNRVATKFGTTLVDGMNCLLMLLPGTATIYNGDELGMEDTFLTWEETTDVRACATDADTYHLYSRDPMRSPFHWDDTISAGFSTNSTTKVKVNENYLTLNVAAQKKADVSHFKNVQAMIKLRDTTVIRKGRLNIQVIDDTVIAFTREYGCEKPIVVLINWDKTTPVTVNLDVFEKVPKTVKVIIADIFSGIKVGDVYDKTSVTLPGNAAVVLRGI